MAFRPKKPNSAAFPTTLLLLLLTLSAIAILLLHSPSISSPSCRNAAASSARSKVTTFSGDLRHAHFSWNSLRLAPDGPPPARLRIAVFTRKWPVSSAPGGMERHALTLHSALSGRGHAIHVFTSAPSSSGELPPEGGGGGGGGPRLHFLSGTNWRCDEAWALYEAETEQGGAFDVVHSESVAVFHRWARGVPNLVVSWHGISLEALHSGIYQDLARRPDEPLSPAFNRSLGGSIYKVLDEIRFFHHYAHHVAISDSTGEMLRDVYQIPSGRVHVILNGVEEDKFAPDASLGDAFRAEMNIPLGSSALVMGVAGRLVKDKGHPLLYEAFAKLSLRHPNVYLMVAGSGPWAQRYAELGRNVVVLGPVPPEKLRAFYNSLDVFLNPTLRPQGLDLTLMEAMQCGKPVAATRFPSIKGTIVVDDEFGYTFAPNVEALLEVLEKVVGEGPARLAERGRACKDYAQSLFTATKMSLAYERLFLCIKNNTYCSYPLPVD